MAATIARITADEVRVSKDKRDEWVAVFYLEGKEMFTIRPDGPGDVFVITGLKIETLAKEIL